VKVFKFATGLAVGYVLGSRAGRDKYEQIAAAARKAQNHPAVTQVQQKAKDLLSTAADSAATGTEPVPVPAGESTTAASADPVPRPARRQPKSGALAVPDVATEPLA
jgi:hypothetical protein